MSNSSGVASSLKHVGATRMRPDGARGGKPAHFDVLDRPRSGIEVDGEGGWGGAGLKRPSLSKSNVVLVGELGMVLVGMLGVVLVGWCGSSKFSSFNPLCIPGGPSSMTARSLDALSSTNRTSHDAINEC
jgi:hypothetical protein